MSDKIDFARNVIKGKIAEQVFEFMFRSVDQYDVIPFGYEYSQPQLAQHINLLKEKNLLDTLRNTPDFLLISKDKSQAYYVEVKYRKILDDEEVKTLAQNLVNKWNHAFLFIATPEGFYSSACHDILNKGKIDKLQEWIVPTE